jgi:Ala-tRNA(Pro) deacylase
LLLKNKQKNKFYMVVLEDNKRLDWNIIRKYFWENKISFVSEELMIEKIWVKPGHVSPFATINNEEKDITVVFNRSLEGSKIWIHPLQNDNTIVIKTEDISHFLDNIGINYCFIEL